MTLLFDPPQPVIAETTAGVGWPVRRLYCLGKNYADHVVEMGGAPRDTDLPIFTKFAGAVAPSGAAIGYPAETTDWHHEVELVAAISKGGEAIPESDALGHVWGYAVGIDMTRRDLQARSKAAGAPWDWAKNGPHTAPLGPIAPVETTGHLSAGAIRLWVNDALRQDGDLAQRIWGTAATIAYVSRFFPLEQGDLVFTGTPAGVGAVGRGDRMRAAIDGLPELHVTIV